MNRPAVANAAKEISISRLECATPGMVPSGPSTLRDFAAISASRPRPVAILSVLAHRGSVHRTPAPPRFAIGANLPAVSARPATDGGAALVVAHALFRIPPGLDASRLVISPAVPHHASLVLRRGRHTVQIWADLLIAGAGGRLQAI